MLPLWKHLEPRLSAGQFWAAIDGSSDRGRGLGNTWRDASPWTDIEDWGLGFEQASGEGGTQSPWLHDELHYKEILRGDEIDYRTSGQKRDDKGREEWDESQAQMYVKWEESESSTDSRVRYEIRGTLWWNNRLDSGKDGYSLYLERHQALGKMGLGEGLLA